MMLNVVEIPVERTHGSLSVIEKLRKSLKWQNVVSLLQWFLLAYQLLVVLISANHAASNGFDS